MNTSLLALLACPECRKKLTLLDNQSGFLCQNCRVVYPIEDEIPLLLKEKAVPFAQWEVQQKVITKPSN